MNEYEWDIDASGESADKRKENRNIAISIRSHETMTEKNVSGETIEKVQRGEKNKPTSGE